MQHGVVSSAQMKVEVSPGFRTEVKIRAARRGLTMRAYVAEAVREKIDAEDAERGEADGSRQAMPEEQNARGDAPRGSPVAGDPACVWHALDAVLSTLREGRDALEKAGLDELAEELQMSVEALEPAYAEAEERLAKL